MAASPQVSPRTRAALAAELLALAPALRRRLQAGFPADLTEELGGATPHQMEALHLLHLAVAAGGGGVGATMNELARKQSCALSTATALVDRLLRQGLAERIADADDRRLVRIVPTARGEQLCAKFTAAKGDLALAWIAPLDDEEAETLIHLLRKVAGAEAVTHD